MTTQIENMRKPLENWLDALDDLDEETADAKEFQVVATRIADNRWSCTADCLDEPVFVNVE
ncbi:hypothetical protein [Burkholderia stagnalis]|uniref:hypothetical protein n=1 Tax=Burkholderia stagnalis TaxID=1503054 RepID=UPI000F5750E7|nr:hypothetical protein [Burkholderia stagnalis]